MGIAEQIGQIVLLIALVLGVGWFLNVVEESDPSFKPRWLTKRRDREERAYRKRRAQETSAEREARNDRTMIDLLRYRGLTKAKATREVERLRAARTNTTDGQG